MKALISVIFGILIAAVLGAGAWLSLENRRAHVGLLETEQVLSVQVEELETELSKWEGKPEDVRRRKAELDSIVDTLSKLEPEVAAVLTQKRELNRRPELDLGEPAEQNGWRTYPFTLTIQGKPEAVEGFVTSIKDQLPVMNIERFQAQSLLYNQEKLSLTGIISFPVTD